MPRTTAYFQAQAVDATGTSGASILAKSARRAVNDAAAWTTVTNTVTNTAMATTNTAATVEVASVAFENGEFVVSANERVHDDNILFIVRSRHQRQDDDHPQEYQVCWLHEATTSDDTEQAPFAFSTAVIDESALQKLPDDVLRRHLLTDIAPVFRGEASPSSLYVVVSTRSGLGQAQAFYDSVLEPLLGVFGLTTATVSADGVPANGVVPTGHESYNLLVTSSSRSITEFAQGWAKTPATPTNPPATIVLLSGDGGVVDLLNGMAEQDDQIDPQQLPVVALLPLGTGTALFHSLHRPDYVAAATAAAAAADVSTPVGTNKPVPTGPSSFVLGLRTLFKGHAAPLPNFEARFSPGSHTVSYSQQEEEGKGSSLKEQAENVDRLRGAIVASYGFHAQLVWESDTPEYRKHGDKRFGMAAQELLKTSHAYDADVSLTEIGDDNNKIPPRSLGHRLNYVLASMVSNLEKTFTISPASQPLDGQLRLVHFGAVGGEKTMEIMMAAYNNGAHIGMRWPREAGEISGAESKEEPDEQNEEGVGYDAICELQVNVLEKDARWRKVCIDGTIVEIPQGGWMKVRRATKPVLQVIVNV